MLLFLQVDERTRVSLFCYNDFTKYPSEMEDCFSAAAFDVLEKAANVCMHVSSSCVYLELNVYRVLLLLSR